MSDRSTSFLRPLRLILCFSSLVIVASCTSSTPLLERPSLPETPEQLRNPVQLPDPDNAHR